MLFHFFVLFGVLQSFVAHFRKASRNKLVCPLSIIELTLRKQTVAKCQNPAEVILTKDPQIRNATDRSSIFFVVAG